MPNNNNIQDKSTLKSHISRYFLQIEGLSILSFSIITYIYINGNWLLFIIILFAPDLFMVGYLKNDKIGAIVYNIGHIYLDPVILCIIGMIWDVPLCIELGLIWLAHISMDRALGYGLKLTSGFKNTHLQKL